MRAQTEYTPATVRDIAERTSKGQSDTSLAHYLGWDLDRLRTIARRHGIELISVEPAATSPYSTARLTASAWVNETKERRGIAVSAPRPSIKPKPKPDPKIVNLSARRIRRAQVTASNDPMVMPGWNMTRSQRDAIRAFAQQWSVGLSEAMRRVIAAGLTALEKA